MAKNPASQMIRDIVDNFIKRSMIEAKSKDIILFSELRSTGAAY
jgi:hypothetical protein